MVIIFYFYKTGVLRPIFCIVVGLDDKPTKYKDLTFSTIKARSTAKYIRQTHFKFPRNHRVWKDDRVAFNIMEEELPYQLDITRYT